ncbi:NUDIX hydrolase (plasmid) [Pseudomonas sp. FeN3W]|nr:NUDIX hydrolase [Pseudomonas sp. FeN3W]
MTTNTVMLLQTPFFNVVQEGKYYMIKERAVENGVVIAAQREDGRYLLARLFRMAIGQYSFEFPRGAVDKGEDATKAAYRELSEETGVSCSSVTILGRMHSNTSLLSSHVALAHALVTDVSEGDTDGEVDSTQWLSVEQLDEMMVQGLITDSHTLSLIAMIKARGL